VTRPVPLVSVCIPTYNYARFLPRTIESVLGQTHSELELVVLDDASTDDTTVVVQGYAGDPRLRFVRHERNVGLFANFNACLDEATGDYVKVLCADDWLHERSLEDGLAALERSPSAGLATSPAWHVDVAGRVTGMVRAPFGAEPRVVPREEAIRAHAVWGNVAGMPTHVLLRREQLNRTGGFEPEFAPASDVHLWLKVLAGSDLAWVPEPRCYVRLHAQHEHGYAYEANESVFLLWKDIARRAPEAVDAAVLRTALLREAHHHMLYVGARLLKADVGGVRRLLGSMRSHVPLRSALARFVVTAPRAAFRQGLRLFAKRSGRLLVYGPAPRPGPRLRELERGA
jgi:hypothetical protein